MGNPPLPPDGSGEIDADLAAMDRDAGVWGTAAERMGTSLAAAQQLTFSPYDLSSFAYSTGMTSAYQDIQQWTCGLLTGAHQNLQRMADILRRSAANYAEQDTGAAQSFAQLQPGEDR